MAFPPKKVPPRMPFVRKPNAAEETSEDEMPQKPKAPKGKTSPLADAIRRKQGQQGGC